MPVKKNPSGTSTPRSAAAWATRASLSAVVACSGTASASLMPRLSRWQRQASIPVGRVEWRRLDFPQYAERGPRRDQRTRLLSLYEAHGQVAALTSSSPAD